MDAMLRRALREFLGLLKQLYTNLLGEEGEMWGNELKKFLRKEPCWTTRPIFPVWRTIQIGLHQSVEKYQEALDVVGYKVSGNALNMIRKEAFSVSSVIKHIPLVKVTARKLGFTESPTFGEFFARAREFDLGCCPAEVGPALRLAYNDQPEGELIRVAMDNIFNSVGNQGVFDVERDQDTIWLGGVWFHDLYRFYIDDVWVFRSRNKAA